MNGEEVKLTQDTTSTIGPKGLNSIGRQWRSVKIFGEIVRMKHKKDDPINNA